MTDRRRGLGRGLGALIPAAPGKADPPSGGPSPVDVLIPAKSRDAAAGGAPGRSGSGPGAAADDAAAADRAAGGDGAAGQVGGAHFAEVPLDAITPNPRQPREVFDEEALAELVHSLREVGMLQPVVVRPLGEERYELIMGERRWRAARVAGFTAIPAIVRSTGDDAMLRDALLENLHRSQLNPLEEAAAYDQLLQDFGCTHDQLAGRIGRSRPQISNTLRLLKLPRWCSGGSRRESCPPGTLAPCSVSTTGPPRNGWPSASSPRGSRCAPSRRSSPWAGNRRPSDGRRPRSAPWHRSWRSSPTGWPTASRPA